MWCDNCLLLFPLRAGAIFLGVFMALYQIAGSIILFKIGDYFFFHGPEASIYGGYGMAQGFMALIAVLGFSNRSFMITKLLFRIYPFIVFVGAVRAGLMSWALQNWQSRIVRECELGGSKWESNTNGTDTYSNEQGMPSGFCSPGVHNTIVFFTTCLVLDFFLMIYFLFLIWRFYVKLRHYPLQKGTGGAMFEQRFYWKCHFCILFFCTKEWLLENWILANRLCFAHIFTSPLIYFLLSQHFFRFWLHMVGITAIFIAFSNLAYKHYIFLNLEIEQWSCFRYTSIAHNLYY